MPKAKKHNIPVATPEPAAPIQLAPVVAGADQEPVQSARPARTIIYDKVETVEYSTVSPKGPLTVDRMKVVLGWEVESDYQKRMVVEQPDSKPEHWLYGEAFHCLDTDKRKVRCWNNANNRPFDMGWCEDLVHTVLHGHWAGPLTVPGETVNGETIRISRYGRVLSGQHQGTALVLADEHLQKSRQQKVARDESKWPFWDGHDHCVIESLVVTGLSEDERVLRTIDYVKPRTTADMLYTMELFRNNTSTERKEMTRMLSGAIDMLWSRTDTKGYKTHPEVVGFLERHPRLLKCVEHIFLENNSKGGNEWECAKCKYRAATSASSGDCPAGGKHEWVRREGRKISFLRVNTGHASALCYLMGSAGPGTDGDIYRNESPPSEKGLDWYYWAAAKDFWSRLARDRAFIPVRTALGRLLDSTQISEDNQGLGGRLPEKLSILAKAWSAFKDDDCGGQPFSMEDLAGGGLLCLSYSSLDSEGNELPEGQIALIPEDDFGGIDCPEGLGKPNSKAAPMPPPPTREEIERATQEALARRATASAKK